MTMVINGSGTITGLTAGGLPDATITQADLAANVAGNGPAFSAYNTSGTQTITANAWTKLVYNGEYFDTNNNFDSVTNYRFTPTIAGYYQISFNVQFVGATTQNTATRLYKNGSNFEEVAGVASAGQYTHNNGSNLVYMNGSTDYLELYMVLVAATQAVNPLSFSGVLVRAA